MGHDMEEYKLYEEKNLVREYGCDPRNKWVQQKNIKKNVMYVWIKRGVDFFGSLFGIVLLAPIFFLIIVMIKREEKNAPILFKQSRVGLNGEKFQIYKFRTMCVDAEEKLHLLLKKNEIKGAMFKMKEDPRVTRIGFFLRKTSLDELPQLINVLKGEMSLVGPRPPLPREIDEYTTYDMQRLLVKPGCSGLWQVSGRNDLDFSQMVELDLEYIIKRSLLLDIKIILKTVAIMIKPNSSY